MFIPSLPEHLEEGSIWYFLDRNLSESLPAEAYIISEIRSTDSYIDTSFEPCNIIFHKSINPLSTNYRYKFSTFCNYFMKGKTSMEESLLHLKRIVLQIKDFPEGIPTLNSLLIELEI